MALGYFAVSSILIAIFAENLAHPVRLLATRACVVALILLLCRGVNILIPDNANPTDVHAEVLALLAALVSASVLFVLL